MPNIFTLEQIKAVLDRVDLLAAMEKAFVDYSAGKAEVPPVGELLFDNPPGDTHIKYGYIKGDDHFVVKIASGFYDNTKIGLPSNSGLMLVFSARTGVIDTILLDEGHLTDARTAAAGAFAASLLAPKNVQGIGILGSGVQARMQLEMLRHVTDCKRVSIYARSSDKADAYAREMQTKGYDVTTQKTPQDVAAASNLIVTTTAASTPLLAAADIRRGTHITAMGSDTPHKQELAVDLLAKADLVAADSIAQCKERGEIFHALAAGGIGEAALVELGTLAARGGHHRPSDDAITIADLTGVAVQDIEISKAVMLQLSNR